MDAVRDQRQADDRRGVEQGQQFDKILRVLEKRIASIQEGDEITPKLGLPAKGLHECPKGLPIAVSDDLRRNILQYILVHERGELLEGSEHYVVCEWDFLAHAQPMEECDVIAHREIVGHGNLLSVPSGIEQPVQFGGCHSEAVCRHLHSARHQPADYFQ